MQKSNETFRPQTRKDLLPRELSLEIIINQMVDDPFEVERAKGCETEAVGIN